MRDFNPRPELRPDAFEFSGAPNGGSFVRSRPRRPFSNAEENELALELLQLTSELSSSGLLAVFSRKHGGASSRSGRKSLGLSGGSSRRSSRRRCLPW
jgi:hypothetical protein